jgi:hypothetical protein
MALEEEEKEEEGEEEEEAWLAWRVARLLCKRWVYSILARGRTLS